VALDELGVCGGCRNSERKRAIDWTTRAKTFGELARRAKARGRRYDCLIPVSGGKDSFWQVVTCLEHDLHPLCVTYVVPGRTELGASNLRALVALGVDHVEFRSDPRTERAFVVRAFRELAISGLVTHMAIFSVPLQIAVAQQIPLVVYGENSAFEYGSEHEGLDGARLDRRWLRHFGVTAGTTAEDWIDATLTRRALAPYFLPEDTELQRSAIDVAFLGHYFPWDPQHSLSIARAHGFRVRAEGPRVGHYDFVNIDDDMIGVHHHPKWHKFGITRAWDTLSMEIRAGRLSRAAAIGQLHALGAEPPWEDIAAFCRYTGLTQSEYFAVVERFRDRSLWSRRAGRWEIEGFLVPDFPWPADAPA
jgi:N-acetyl sugar amidotransferase